MLMIIVNVYVESETERHLKTADSRLVLLNILSHKSNYDHNPLHIVFEENQLWFQK